MTPLHIFHPQIMQALKWYPMHWIILGMELEYQGLGTGQLTPQQTQIYDSTELYIYPAKYGSRDIQNN